MAARIEIELDDRQVREHLDQLLATHAPRSCEDKPFELPYPDGEYMLRYPATLEVDGTGFCVSFRDIPEALTGAATLEEARIMAAEALRAALDFYFEDQRLVPAPSESLPNEELIALPASVTAKVLLLNELIAQHVTPSELAKRMGTTRQEMNRILDLNHTTKIDTIEWGLKCLGKVLDVSVIR